MPSTLNQLREQLDGLQQQYYLHFAGQPRVTRNLEMMRQMAVRAGALRSELATLAESEARTAALALAAERLELYRGEVAAIDAARVEVGDRGVEAAWLGQRANHVFHRYRRHFAGRSRSGRDISILQEMISDLDAIRGEMATLGDGWRSAQLTRDREIVDNFLGLFRQEVREIKAARDGADGEQAESLFAQLANDQFEQYRLHFAGQPRVSRRPELLEQMCGNLEAILSRMQALPSQGFHGAHNPQNARIVVERLAAWRGELEGIREVRTKTSLSEMVSQLGRAAEVVLEVYNERYAGQARASRDLGLLCGLCDRLVDLERQMETIGRVQTLVDNERNLELVHDLMHMLEAEYDEIDKAQQAGAAASSGPAGAPSAS